MMKEIFFIMILFFVNISNAQKRDRIYRIAIESHDAIGYSYQILVLTLSDNQEYSLIEQKYKSKKFAMKNIPFDYSKSFGVWEITNDTLKLINKDNRREMLFVVKRDYLDFLFNGQESGGGHWKRVRQ